MLQNKVVEKVEKWEGLIASSEQRRVSPPYTHQGKRLRNGVMAHADREPCMNGLFR